MFGRTQGFGIICDTLDRRVIELTDTLNRLGFSTYFVADASSTTENFLNVLDVRKNPAPIKNEALLKKREEFLAICAHDLRSPLGIIQSAISLTLQANGKEFKLPPTYAELLERARRQTIHSLQLVKDLLDVTVLDQGLKPRYEILPLDSILKELIKGFEIQASEKEIQVEYENPVPQWKVCADGDRIHQLLQNLFTNAVKFTERGKKILLTVIPFQGRRKSDPPHPMLIVSLKDEGKGIPTDELQKIFDRFAQVRESGSEEGRGLGLTVAKQITTLHGGNIWANSVEGSGSTFFILLPHVLVRTVTETFPNRILVVDPSAHRRENYFSHLVEWGYEPFFANDGVEALTLFSHHAPATVILTPELQKMSEVDVANLIKTEMGESTQIYLASEETTQIDQLGPFDGAWTLPLAKDPLSATIKFHGDHHLQVKKGS